MMEIPMVVFQGYVILCCAQLVLWLVHYVTRDASWADVGWAMGMVFIAGWYIWNFDGFSLRSVALLTVLTIWAMRISGHLIQRIVRRGSEDRRYAYLRKQWGSSAPGMFFLVFQFQPVLNVVLSIPFLLVALNPDHGISVIEIAALCLWGVGFSGEWISDKQLKNFLSDPANRGKICRVGWWNYSRHPNYFFEWLMWVSYAFFALASPGGFAAFLAPAVMVFLLLKVTGIPLMEQMALESKGDKYREYMQTTSPFVPWSSKTKRTSEILMKHPPNCGKG
jgi:steroid 5-alpha reductase family enzyme